jgi:flagellar biosynthetic protein FliR
MIERTVLELLLLALRTASFVVFFPVFNDGRLPRLVKIGFSLSLAWLLFTTPGSALQAGLTVTNIHWIRLAILVIGEVLFGAALGFAFGILIEPARIAGAYIGQELGLTMAATTDPTRNQQTNVVTQIFESLAVLAFFVLDIHHVFLRVMKVSLVEFPIGQGIVLLPGTAAAHQADLASRWGLMIASPVGICLFITIVALGLLMRSVPQMNVFAVGLSIRLGVGLFATVLFLPVMFEMISRVLRQAEFVVPTFFST